jgi:hypothetical protein
MKVLMAVAIGVVEPSEERTKSRIKNGWFHAMRRGLPGMSSSVLRSASPLLQHDRQVVGRESTFARGAHDRINGLLIAIRHRDRGEARGNLDCDGFDNRGRH